ncbi:MAG TPA: TetR-like C-terminal domain-containing protein, partial [Streptosporangiaceae bacterium]|nr:TetR-like C-terminal domain-containing protein [Streptosporangiaceae bacterium]
EIFTELAAEIDRAMREANAAVPTASSADGGADVERLTAEMVTACRGFRTWALSHRAEFGLVFGVPLPGIDDGRYDIAEECALRFAGVYFGLFTKLWLWHPFPVPATPRIAPALREQLDRYARAIGTDLPPGAVLTFLRCWMLLYGAVAMELFGHLSFALDDPSPLFELTLRDMAALVGLDYPVDLDYPGPRPLG